MHTSTLTPAYEPLPFGRTVPAGNTLPGGPVIDPAAVARFDALLHEINPDAARVDADRLQGLTRWLASLTPETAHGVLLLRLRRMDELRSMLADPDWNTGPALRQRIQKLLAYLDQGDNLIPQDTPVIGLLDDVLLFELAWPVFEAEAEEYRDFCAWRDSEHPSGNGDQQRAAWLRDRMAELALLRHQARVHAEHYIDVSAPRDVFHVA